MAKQLEIRLLPNWADVSGENPGGPATYARTNSKGSGALQVSLAAEYRGGRVPNPSQQDLIRLAQGYGESQQAGSLVSAASGDCQLGTYGTAVFRSAANPHLQLWLLSNGRDFVLATHVCVVEPETAECTEAQQIVSMIGLSG